MEMTTTGGKPPVSEETSRPGLGGRSGMKVMWRRPGVGGDVNPHNLYLIFIL
ncbi:skin secretory protein xP2-like [Iris pallida]|nr:skin secretory protein xP2-like [Iris pallida]